MFVILKQRYRRIKVDSSETWTTQVFGPMHFVQESNDFGAIRARRDELTQSGEGVEFRFHVYQRVE